MAPEKKIFEIPDYEDAPLTDEELFRFRVGETDCALVRADYLTPERVDGVDQSDVPAIMRAVAAPATSMIRGWPISTRSLGKALSYLTWWRPGKSWRCWRGPWSVCRLRPSGFFCCVGWKGSLTNRWPPRWGFPSAM